MTTHPLASLPERLDALGADLTERLMRRFGAAAPAALHAAGVLTPLARAFFDDRSLPFEPRLARFVALSLYGDCLTAVALACLNARPAVDWGRLEGARPLLARIGSYYATVFPSYGPFRSLPREGLTDFLNAYAADEGLFGLRCDDTRLMGARLCRHLSWLGEGDLLGPYLEGGPGELWRYTCPRVGVAPELAAAIWGEVRASVA